MDRYADWIKTALDGGSGYGKCQEVCEAMQSTFPELEIRKGLFHSLLWGDRTHWWLRDRKGRIVDPTANQHPDGVMFPSGDDRYTDVTDMPIEEAQQIIPTGKCMDCGGPCFGDRTSICSDACEESFRAYLG